MIALYKMPYDRILASSYIQMCFLSIPIYADTVCIFVINLSVAFHYENMPI